MATSSTGRNGASGSGAKRESSGGGGSSWSSSFLARLPRHLARPTAASLVNRVPFPFRSPVTPVGVEPPVQEPTLGAHYDTEWARSMPARLARRAIVDGVGRPLISVLADPDRHNLDRLDHVRGPVIFAANHSSHADTPVLLTSIPERFRKDLVVAAAADYFFGTKATAALSALAIGAIPMERTRISRRNADEAADLLDDGWSLLIYPEGGRSPDGWAQPFKGGAAYLAVRCGVPVVPVHVAGSDRILRKGRTLPRRSKVTVNFGHPLVPRPDEESRHFAGRIEDEVAVLADEALTDWWSARRRAHAGTTPPLGGPDAPTWRRAWTLGDRSPQRRKRSTDRAWPPLD